MTITQSAVAAMRRDEHWMTYHTLVVDEACGHAPDGTDCVLAVDPFRWAAHLGCAIADLAIRLDTIPHRDAQHRAARHRMARLTARKGEVVALRKRSSLTTAVAHAQGRQMQLEYALRQILEAIDSIDMDGTVLDRISVLASDALGVPTS